MATETQAQAGPELDAEIARRVFGMEIRPAQIFQGYVHRVLTDCTTASKWAECQPYSTDIAAAWLVVERMRGIRPGCGVSVSQFRGDQYGRARCGTWNSNASTEGLIPPRSPSAAPRWLR